MSQIPDFSTVSLTASSKPIEPERTANLDDARGH